MTSNNLLKYYWCVAMTKEDNKIEEIYLYADSLDLTNGNIMFFQLKEDMNIPIFCIPNGNWEYFYAASCIDGRPVHVEHWDSKNISYGCKENKEKDDERNS